MTPLPRRAGSAGFPQCPARSRARLISSPSLRDSRKCGRPSSRSISWCQSQVTGSFSSWLLVLEPAWLKNERGYTAPRSFWEEQFPGQSLLSDTDPEGRPRWPCSQEQGRVGHLVKDGQPWFGRISRQTVHGASAGSMRASAGRRSTVPAGSGSLALKLGLSCDRFSM